MKNLIILINIKQKQKMLLFKNCKRLDIQRLIELYHVIDKLAILYFLLFKIIVILNHGEQKNRFCRHPIKSKLLKISEVDILITSTTPIYY